MSGLLLNILRADAQSAKGWHSAVMMLHHATLADAGAIAEIQIASWRDAYAGLLPADFLDRDYPALCHAQWRATLAAPPPGVVLMAEARQGFIAAWLHEGEAHIDSLHVIPGQRGKGLGQRLLGQAMACLMQMGARSASLKVLAGNSGALSFYARLGGRTAPPQPASLLGIPVELHRVSWDGFSALLPHAMHLSGPRLTLRPPNGGDAEAFFALNGHPQVMRWFAAPMTRAQSDAWLDRMIRHQAEHGFTFCAVDLPCAACVGVVGLLNIPWQARFTPAVEIGWRIHPAWQRRGLAEKAARMALAHAFATLRLPEIVAFTVPGNTASWRLMGKLGMAADGAFEHPRLPQGHPLRKHLLYRIKAPLAP